MEIAHFLGYHVFTIILMVWAILKKNNPWVPVIIAVVLEAFAFYGSAAEAHLRAEAFPMAQLIGSVVVLAIGAVIVYLKHRGR